MFVPIKPEVPEVEVTPRTDSRPAQGSRDNWRAVRLLRAMVVVADIFMAEEERLVIEVEGEGTSVPPPPNRPEIRVSPFMDHDDVTYVDSPLRGQEDFYRQALAYCPDRPSGHFDRA